MSNLYISCENVSDSKRKRIGGSLSQYSKITFFDLNYGARAMAWETEDGLWIKNSYYSCGGIELNAGLQVFINKLNLSFDFVSNSLKTAEFKIGSDINIK